MTTENLPEPNLLKSSITSKIMAIVIIIVAGIVILLSIKFLGPNNKVEGMAEKVIASEEKVL